jgi:hypothetical protein
MQLARSANCGFNHDLCFAERAPTLPARLPDFIAVGPIRTATTWLYRFLTGSVGLPENIKETRFFDRDYEQGLATYASRFVKCPPELPVCEIAPTYFYNVQTRKRIAQHIPHCGIIISLRDPVERLHSAYRLDVWEGRTWCSFEDEMSTRWDTMVEKCDYAKHVSLWQESFGKQRVLIVLYDDFVRSPQRYVDDICEFIGIPNIAIGEGPVSPDERVYAIPRVPRGVAFARLYRRFTRSLYQHGIDSLMGLGNGNPIRETIVKLVYRDLRLNPDTEARLRRAVRQQVEELEILLHRNLAEWKPL